MKILFLITGLGLGGAERFVVSLADHLVKRGHTVCIAFLTGEAHVTPVQNEVELVSLKMGRKYHILPALINWQKLVRRFRPDVVHSHMVHANLFARMARPLIPLKRLISTAHSSDEGGRLRMEAYRWTNFLADAFTNVSQEAVLSFERRGAVKPRRMITIPNGIDLSQFAFSLVHREEVRNEQRIDNSVRVLLSTGRLHPAKDYPTLLQALAILRKEGVGFIQWIVGDGPLRVELEALTMELQLQDYVKFFGTRPDVGALLSAADIFVMSSAWEGLPMALLEAMANGKPIVATDCGGIKGAVGSGHFIAPVKNPNALALSLKAALQLTTNQLEQLGSANLQQVGKHYSLDAVANRWLTLYAAR